MKIIRVRELKMPVVPFREGGELCPCNPYVPHMKDEVNHPRLELEEVEVSQEEYERLVKENQNG